TTVKDGEKISLGDKTLEFIYTPWVHWPETISTYLTEDKILFTCDFFGSHYATSELFTDCDPVVYEAAKRYYAEIMMPFRSVIRKNMEKINGREIVMIAPSHGPVYRQVEYITNAYKDWISDSVENEVVLPYVSMHGSTERMVEFLIGELAAHNVKVRLFDLAVTDLGKLAIAMVDAATLVIGTPTVNVGPHPLVFAAANLANILRPKFRHISIIGSYGWSSKAVEQLVNLVPNLKAEVIEPVICKGFPQSNDFTALSALADKIAERHKSLTQK
ncbi:MAG: FprA family A-type flavoprotein, partial [Victivallaceae bacterium]|nr:FprA family A-type flavoprotein [Victivallaceae bacterium]